MPTGKSSPIEADPNPAGGSESLPTEDGVASGQIGAVLAELGMVSPGVPIQLHAIPGNPIRRDFRKRRRYRVSATGRPICHLTVASDLADLWRRVRGLAEACPEIVCRPLFHRRIESRDLVGMEYFEGENLETLVAAGQISPREAASLGARVLQSLEKTVRPSTPEDALRELDEFIAEAVASPLFGSLDRAFIQEVLHPLVKSGLLAEPARKRWTNGDFVARNILLGADGQVRLVDYEFARETHFPGDDLYRWRTFSRLPEEALAPARLPAGIPAGEWMEAYFILRQIVLTEATNGPEIALAESQAGFDRLVAIGANATAGYRMSRFLPALARVTASRAKSDGGREVASASGSDADAVNRLEKERLGLESQLAAAQHELAELLHKGKEAVAVGARIEEELNRILALQKTTEARLENLKQSHSWLLTTPLRALRRMLIDPFRRR